MSKVRTPEPEGFDAFWQQWRKIARHTDGRGLARETFRKHVLNGVEPVRHGAVRITLERADG